MPTTFTLDTNCIIAIHELRPASEPILELVHAHHAGRATVGLVAISASERQQDDGYLESFNDFQERIAKLGLGDLEILEPMCYFDVTFWDVSLLCDASMEALEREIHEILFPNIPFLWTDFCQELGVDPTMALPNKKWRNAKCDVQAFWSHAYRKRDVFVTSDKNFHAETKKTKLLEVAGGRIEYPESAISLVSASTDS